MIGTSDPPEIILQPDQRFFCKWPWETVVLMSDGTIVCGCADPFKKRPAGNAAILTIQEIWNGPIFQGIREGLQKNNPVLCSHCNLMGVISKRDSKIPAHKRLDYMPTRLFVEPCISCNLSCYEACCNHENGIHFTRHTRLLSWETYKKVIDELGPGLKRVDFFNYGESFIHPKAIEMIAYAKSRYPHIYFFTSTNGLLLNSDEKLRALVESGIDEMTFSIDGARQETYQIYRRGGDFNKLMKIMKRLVETKKELSRDTPFINWRYILFRWNDSDEEMDQARKLATELDIDNLCWEITDHPANSASERFIPGRPEYESIKEELWGEHGNALKHKTFHATIRPDNNPISAEAGQAVQGTVEVRNSGGGVWPNVTLSGRRHITLGVQLLDHRKNVLNHDLAHVLLPRPIGSGQELRMEFAGPAPQKAGSYWLKFDMVCEGYEWFESFGSPVAYQELLVL